MWLFFLIIQLIFFYSNSFLPALADGFSLKFERQQISSSLQDFSQYSSPSHQCCSLDGLHSFSYFQVIKSLYQSFGDCNERIVTLMFHSFITERTSYHIFTQWRGFVPFCLDAFPKQINSSKSPPNLLFLGVLRAGRTCFCPLSSWRRSRNTTWGGSI